MNNTESTCKILNAIFFLILIGAGYLLANWAFTFIK